MWKQPSLVLSTSLEGFLEFSRWVWKNDNPEKVVWGFQFGVSVRARVRCLEYRRTASRTRTVRTVHVRVRPLADWVDTKVVQAVEMRAQLSASDTETDAGQSKVHFITE